MDRGLIVVGVDGSEGSKAALRWALAEARIRRVPLQVVYVFWALPLLAASDSADLVKDWLSEPARATEAVHTFVRSTVGERTHVEIRPLAVQGTAAESLIDAARSADLLVVGAHPGGRLSGLLLGSVSAQCLHHAGCPVVIVPGAPSTPAGRSSGSSATGRPVKQRVSGAADGRRASVD
jgi:nucleotide-binding universal stress UspA family protein